MDTNTLYVIAGAWTLFLGVFMLVRFEARQGKRMFLGGVRTSLDIFFFSLEQVLCRVWQHTTRYVVQLNWYYSLHALLKGGLSFLNNIYAYVETAFENNRRKTRALRLEKREKETESHLDHITTHKEETSLTPAQERKLKDRYLNGN